jgi:cytochrome P450
MLRKYPVRLLMRRTAEDVELGGNHLPPGTEAIISPHAMHHNPEHFPDPERFDPDRWTPDRDRHRDGDRLSRYRLVPVQPPRTKFTNAAHPVGPFMKAVPR